jgi:hypothetical protein
VIEVALKLKELSPCKNFVNRYLLSDVTNEASNVSLVFQGIQASNPDIAKIWSQKSGKNSQCCGFASTIGSQQAIKASFRDLQAQIPERWNRPVRLFQVIEHDQGHETVHKRW